jgi:hypothetical protein
MVQDYTTAPDVGERDVRETSRASFIKALSDLDHHPINDLNITNSTLNVVHDYHSQAPSHRLLAKVTSSSHGRKSHQFRRTDLVDALDSTLPAKLELGQCPMLIGTACMSPKMCRGRESVAVVIRPDTCGPDRVGIVRRKYPTTIRGPQVDDTCAVRLAGWGALYAKAPRIRPIAPRIPQGY